MSSSESSRRSRFESPSEAVIEDDRGDGAKTRETTKQQDKNRNQGHHGSSKRRSRRWSRVALSLVVEEPLLWWPNGYGGQPLYNLTLTMDVKNPLHKVPGGEEEEEEEAKGAAAPQPPSSSLLLTPKTHLRSGSAGGSSSRRDGGRRASISRRVGLRTIELVQEPVPGDAAEGRPAGKSFYFEVNGTLNKGVRHLPPPLPNEWTGLVFCPYLTF